MKPHEYQPPLNLPVLHQVIEYVVTAFEHNIITSGHTHGTLVAYSRDLTTFTESKWVPQ